MPELPEVETTRRGIEPLLCGRRVVRVAVRNPHLRWRVPPQLARALPGQTIVSVARRAKYLLLGTAAGSVIIHLGMSGSLRVTDAQSAPHKHDHVDIVLDDGRCLRLHDPRRFGAVLWSRDPAQHPLLADLGPEPLGKHFSGRTLFAATRGRRRALRDFLLDGKVVAGIGNIYANEALFLARLRPTRAAGTITREQATLLARAIRGTLTRALRVGGTTLRDFLNPSGEPGYFQLKLRVYGRAGQSCFRCGSKIQHIPLGQRSAFFCKKCQL